MASQPSKIDLRNTKPLPFEVIASLQPYEPSWGLSQWLDGKVGPQDLPPSNIGAYLLSEQWYAQVIGGLIDEVIRVRAGQVSAMFDEQRQITRSMLTSPEYTFLRFSQVSPGLPVWPTRETQYIFFKNGAPLFNALDVILVPNSGLRFSVAWGADDLGILWVIPAATQAQTRRYQYYASSFEGDDYTTCNLSNLGLDLLGQSINPMPTIESQVTIFRPTLVFGAGNDYTFAMVSGDPVITFNAPLRADQGVQIWINKQV